MAIYLRKALKDIAGNGFINAVTVATIALAVLIISAFALVFINASDLFDTWRQGVRLMVYLETGISEAKRLEIKYHLQQIGEIAGARFISKSEALERLRREMDRQASLLDGLEENPLPDAFEVDLKPEAVDQEQVERIVRQIEQMAGIDEVAYGQQWLKRFAGLLELFRVAGYGLGALFSMAAIFFVANTIRLVLYSRQEEIAIMRLVGASERFIRTPFYIQALLQGAAGGLLGLAILCGLYLATLDNLAASLGGFGFTFRFLPWHSVLTAVGASMGVGWIGCFVSLKQFLATA